MKPEKLEDQPIRSPKIAFITNLCAHYNVGTFELLASQYHMDFYFFSAGEEWYWPREHGYRHGNFRSEYLPGFRLGKTRITPSLVWKLLLGKYDVFVKCINGKFALPLTYLVARLRRKPFILWTGVWTRIQTPKQQLIFPLTRYIYRHSDAIVVYGDHVKRYLISEGVSADQIFVAHHAVDNDLYAKPVPATEKRRLRSDLGLSEGEKIILYLGRLEEIKGVRFLIEAFEYLKSIDCVLVIAGSGTYGPLLQDAAARSRKRDRIRFVGYVPVDLTPKYYSLAWVYVLPSISVASGKELWGLSVNEAMNQGLPVITTDAVGAAAGGLVIDGINGFVIPEKDSQALANALDRVLSEPELHQRMSVRAKATVADWNYERNVSGYRQAIEYVLDHAYS